MASFDLDTLTTAVQTHYSLANQWETGTEGVTEITVRLDDDRSRIALRVTVTDSAEDTMQATLALSNLDDRRLDRAQRLCEQEDLEIRDTGGSSIRFAIGQPETAETVRLLRRLLGEVYQVEAADIEAIAETPEVTSVPVDEYVPTRTRLNAGVSHTVVVALCVGVLFSVPGLELPSLEALALFFVVVSVSTGVAAAVWYHWRAPDDLAAELSSPPDAAVSGVLSAGLQTGLRAVPVGLVAYLLVGMFAAPLLELPLGTTWFVTLVVVFLFVWAYSLVVLADAPADDLAAFATRQAEVDGRYAALKAQYATARETAPDYVSLEFDPAAHDPDQCDETATALDRLSTAESELQTCLERARQWAGVDDRYRELVETADRVQREAPDYVSLAFDAGEYSPERHDTVDDADTAVSRGEQRLDRLRDEVASWQQAHDRYEQLVETHRRLQASTADAIAVDFDVSRFHPSEYDDPESARSALEDAHAELQTRSASVERFQDAIEEFEALTDEYESLRGSAPSHVHFDFELTQYDPADCEDADAAQRAVSQAADRLAALSETVDSWQTATQRFRTLSTLAETAHSVAPESLDFDPQAYAPAESDSPDAALAGLDTGAAALVDEQLQTVETVLDDAATLVDDGRYERAADRFDAVDRLLDVAAEVSTEFTLTRRRDTIEQHERRLDDLRESLAAQQAMAAPASIPTAPAVDLEYDDWSETEPIGSGGNADVSKATVETADGPVTIAIKQPRVSNTLDTGMVEQLLEEAQTWDKLDDNEYVVDVLDYGSEPLPWIAMEYMDAGHLDAMAGEMDLEQKLWTAVAVTEGVLHAHRRGVAHLDLKPENILFRSVENAWNVPKVSDWGLSKHLLEHSKSVEGMTVAYAAPEQFDDEYGATDDITDIYQLGAVFYELFTEQSLFDGQPFEIIDRVKTEQPAPPSDLADLPQALDDVLLRALSKQKADRYGHIVYLRDDLQDISETL